MRKTLLIAAAALAASVISSQAQVYSLNIVGYVNQTMSGGAYNLVSVPLQTSSSNNAEQVFSAIQSGDSILIWTNQSYALYTFGAPGQWLYPDQVTIGPAPLLPAGSAVFYSPGGNETNTYVGTCVLSNTTTPVSLPGGLYTLVGSLPPIGVTSLEDTNLNLPLQSGDQILYWNSVASTYLVYTYGAPGQWLQPDQVTVGPAPALSVAQGFFYAPGGNETWSQNLIVQ